MKTIDPAPAKSISNPLLAELTADQQSLLEIINGPVGTAASVYPTWDYVVRQFDRVRNNDAALVLSTLPVVHNRMYVVPFGLVRRMEGTWPIQRGTRVGLTLAGMRHIDGAEFFCDLVIRFIASMAESERELTPDPNEVVTASVPITRQLLESGADGKHLAPGFDIRVREVLRHEPVLLGMIEDQADGTTTMRLDPSLRHYRGVENIEDYLDRLFTVISDPPALASVPPVSPRLLPLALDHLDAIWRLQFEKHLLGHSGSDSHASLALDCSGIDEFDARMSALYQVLGALQVPEPEGGGDNESGQTGTLVRLGKVLQELLPPEGFERTDQAIETLRAAVRIRSVRQHQRASPELIKRFAALGMAYPPSDWGWAWAMVVYKVTAGLDTIREELQASEAGTGD